MDTSDEGRRHAKESAYDHGEGRRPPPREQGDPLSDGGEALGEGGSADELEALLNQYDAEAHAQSQDALRRGAEVGGKRPGRGALPGMVRGREVGLATPLGADNRGFKLMQKMGELGEGNQSVQILRPREEGRIMQSHAYHV